MTRQFNQRIQCPHCGHDFAAETAFCRWMRAQPELDSGDGIVRADCDHIIHRYKFPEAGRDLQAIMLVEVKTFVDFSRLRRIRATEADTLHIWNQIIRNRRANIHSKPRWQAGTAPLLVRSLHSGRRIMVRSFGVHGLYFSGASPEDSAQIEWDDRKPITARQLIGLLRFELDPDTLRPMELRIHQKREPTLFPIHAASTAAGLNRNPGSAMG